MSTDQPRIVEWDITPQENARAERVLAIEEQVRASLPHENCFCADKDRQVAALVKAAEIEQDAVRQKKHLRYAGTALAVFAANEIVNFVTDGAPAEMNVAELFTTSAPEIVRLASLATAAFQWIKSDLYGVGAARANPRPALGEY